MFLSDDKYLFWFPPLVNVCPFCIASASFCCAYASAFNFCCAISCALVGRVGVIGGVIDDEDEDGGKAGPDGGKAGPDGGKAGPDGAGPATTLKYSVSIVSFI